MPNPIVLNINNVKATYNVQTTLEDKLSVFLAYNAYYTRLEEISSYVEDDPEKKKLFENEGIRVRSSNVEEDNLLDDLKAQVINDILGDGSREAILSGIKAFALIKSKNAYDLGNDYLKVHKELMSKDEYKDRDPEIVKRNALYLVYKKQGIPNATFRGIDELGREISDLLRLESSDENFNIQYREKIVANFEYDEHMTMAQFMDKIGFKDYEKRQYLLDNGCQATDKVYDVFKNKLVADGKDAQTLTDEDVKESIIDEFVEQYSASIYLESNGNKVDRYLHYRTKNTTMDYYLSLLDKDDKAKEEYYKTHNCTADTKLFDLINENSVADLLSVRGIKNPDEILSFLEENNCSLEDRLKDTKITLSVKDYDMFVHTNMEWELNSDVKMDTSVQFKTIIQFSNQFRTKSQKESYYNGRRIAGCAQLPDMPEKQDKTEEKIYNGFLEKGLSKDEASKKTKAEVDYQKWAYGDGQAVLDSQLVDDMIKGYKSAVATAGCKNALKTREDALILDFYDNNATLSNTTFLRSLITSFEGTGTGKKYTNETKDRSSNSKSYDEMLKAIKNYYVKTAANDREGIVDVKENLKEKCLAYISGKEKVRKRQFGKDRFDYAMAMLFDIMPKKDFKELVDRINRKRGVRKGHPDFVTVETYRSRFADIFTEEENREELRQVNAEKDFVTDIPEEYKERFDRVWSVYCKQPQYNDDLYNVFGDDVGKHFAEIEDYFVAVGKGLNSRNLSEKDFAAIAYAGSLTDEAVYADKAFEVSPALMPYKALKTGREYTVNLMMKEVPKDVADHTECIEAGRQSAAEAMRAYAAGDKTKLAHILGSGIRHIAAMCRLSEQVDDTYYCNSEMGQRMVAMLERDPEIKQLVLRNEDYNLIREDVLYINAISQAANIYAKAKEAEKILTNPNEQIEKARKTELLTDIMMLRVLNESKNKYHRAVERSEKYKSLTESAKQVAKQRNESALSLEDGIEKNKMLDLAAHDYYLEKIKAKDLYHNDKLMASINNDKSVTALRKSVKDLIKGGGVDKLDPASAIKSLKDRKILTKLAAVTGKVDSKAASEWNKRVEEQRRDRARSIAARKAREAKDANNSAVKK